MVKKITEDQMALAIQDEEAKAFAEEARFGAGSPVEVRQAAALLELSDNMKRQAKAITKLCQRAQSNIDKLASMKNEIEQSKADIDAARHNIIEASNAAYTAIAEVDTLDKRLAKEACDAFREEIFPELAEQIADKASYAAGSSLYHLQSKVNGLEETIKDLNTKLRAEDRVVVKSRQIIDELAHKPWKILPGSAFFIILAIIIGLSLATTAMSIHTLRPALDGRAQIVYTEQYKSSLESVQGDLKRIQNELDAYKEAYPEGLTEELRHDLNVKNSRI